MAMSRPVRKLSGKKKIKKTAQFVTSLKVGDPVMVVTGGNAKSGKTLKGKVGKILRFVAKKSRVVVEGLNIIKRHKRATSASDTKGIIEKEGTMHISNVRYYSEDLKKPVRIKMKTLSDGKKVRAYLNPKTKELVQIDNA